MNALLLGSVAAASLLGSLHCAAMCGPFVAVYAGSSGAAGSAWAGHLAYQLGRLVTYVSLGIAAGALGSALNWVFDAGGVVEFAAIASSVVLILMGASALMPRRLRPSKLPTSTIWPRRQLMRLGTSPRTVRGGLLGLATPLLPCGWLYGFVVVAAGSGGAGSGALIMATFWAGSVPALLGVGLLLGRWGAGLRARLPRVMAVLWIAVGVLGVAIRSQVHVQVHQGRASEPKDALPPAPACHGGVR